MRFCVDECCGPRIARWLKVEGHFVVSIFDSFRGSDDDTVLRIATEHDAILVTADKDFGEMVIRDRKTHSGVILLRLDNELPHEQISTLKEVIASMGEGLKGKYCVATKQKLRVIE